MFLLAGCLLSASLVLGQGASLKLEIPSPDGAVVRASGDFGKAAKPDRHLAFRNTYAGVNGIAERIMSVTAYDAAGKPLTLKRLQLGEYLADGDVASWAAEIDLTPLAGATSAAHTSWKKGDIAVLYPSDLFPNASPTDLVNVAVSLPDGWEAIGAARLDKFATPAFRGKAGDIAIIAAKKGVILSGSSDRLSLSILGGGWKFSVSQASGFAEEIYREYEKRLGKLSDGIRSITIVPMPATTGFGQWAAETRGRDVVIVSSDMAFAGYAEQKLHEQLRHEIFHLWVPGDLDVKGDYSWFYEGFALYESLRIAVDANRIRFDDMLRTLEQARTSDLVTEPRPLIDISSERWAGTANDAVYARGLLIAFLCDLAELKASGRSDGAERVVREFIAAARARPGSDANEVLKDIFSTNKNLRPIADDHLTGGKRVDLAAWLQGTGLELSDDRPGAAIRVKAKPSGREKRLLDKLGYNNWQRSGAERR